MTPPRPPIEDQPLGAPPPTPADRAGEADIPGARMSALTAYLEVNRDRFTEAALRTAVLAAGYTAAELDRAWPAVASARPGDAIRPRTSHRVVVGTVVAFVVGAWLLLSLAESLSGAIGIPGGPAMWLVIGIAGAIGWFALRDRHPSVSKGLGCGVLIVAVLPIVLIVAVLGFCLVTGNPLTGN